MQSEHDVEELLKLQEANLQRLKQKLKDHLNSDRVAVGYILRISDEIRSVNTEINTLRWVLVKTVAEN